MRIDGPQVTSSLSLNGTTITDLNVFVTTGSLNGLTGSYATTGSNLFNGTQTLSGSIIPAVNNTYDLGSPTNQFRHVYISSGSLYVNGVKVLGSTSQELQITTDVGQSFKILESGSDTITLQSGDGNVTLTSSGQGDIVLDPTTGVIGLKGTVTIYTGNKIVSSDGNSIQFGNGIAVTGSIVSTTTSLVSGSSQITYSGLSGVPSDIISGSGQLTTLGIATTGSNTFNGNLTVTGFIDTQELRTTYISSSILYRSGSTKFGDELTDTHSFTGSILISGSISVPGSNLVSGSSQVLNGSGVFSGSAQLPSGTVSGSSQILNGTGFVKTSGASITYDNSTYLTTGTASSTYLPLAGGIMSGNISYGVGNGVAWYLQPQAVGGGPSNGPVLRLKSHSAAGALTDRSGALAWIDGNGARLDLFEWNSSLINAYVPINGTSAVFSSTITSFSTSGAAAFNNGINIHTQPGTYTAGHGGILQFQNEDVITAGIRGIRDGGSWGGALLFYTHTTSADNTFNTTFTEKVRITTAGDLLVGDDTASANLWVKSSAAGNTFGARNTNTSFGATVGFFGADRNTTNNSFYYIDCYNYGSSSYRFRVADNGNVTSTGSGTFNSTLTIAYNGLSGDFGAGYTTGLGVGYSSSIGKGINMGWNTTLDMGFIGSVHNGTGWKSLILSPIGGAVYIGATGGNDLYAGVGTFSAKVRAKGGSDSGGYYMDYQSDATSRSFRISSEHLVYGDFVIQRSTTRTGTTYEDLLYFNASSAATFSNNLTINNTLSSPGNLIETAGLNIYLRPAAGHTVFVDTGNGLSTNALDIIGEVRYRGSIYDNFNFVASGNYTTGTYYNIVGVNTIPTGIYIFDGEVDTYGAGGGIYFMRFASVPFYMWDVGSNSTTFVDLPPVLGTGHHLGNPFPLFRLQMTGGGAGIHLQFTPNSTWAGMNNTSGKTFRVNLKKIG